MVCCPLTRRIKGYSIEVGVSVGAQPSVVLSDQVKSLDWKAHEARQFGAIPHEAMAQARAKIKASLQIT